MSYEKGTIRGCTRPMVFGEDVHLGFANPDSGMIQRMAWIFLSISHPSAQRSQSKGLEFAEVRRRRGCDCSKAGKYRWSTGCRQGCSLPLSDVAPASAVIPRANRLGNVDESPNRDTPTALAAAIVLKVQEYKTCLRVPSILIWILDCASFLSDVRFCANVEILS
jgi:hypothetical protein